MTTRLRITAASGGANRKPAPEKSDAAVFWAACSAMPVRTDPVRRRIQHKRSPSHVNGMSTPDTPWRPAQTSDDATAAGQKPNRCQRPPSRKPRIESSSIHGAATTATQVRSRTAPAWR